MAEKNVKLTGKAIAGLLALILMLNLVLFFGASNAQAAVPVRGTDRSVPGEGNVMVYARGTFFTEDVDTILDRINEIRYEACAEGVIDAFTGKKLTLADYNPLQWSSAMEWIAQTRAAEAMFYWEHVRLNGKSCFDCSYHGETANAENLAWNFDGIMYGIKQWYDEKEDWVKQTGGVTGHYTSLINPEYNYIGLGCFQSDESSYHTVACEMSMAQGLATEAIGVSGLYDQVLEVQESIKDEFEPAEEIPEEPSDDPQSGLTPGWNNIDGDWYYADQNGNLLTGWQDIDGYRYFLDPEEGYMLTGCLTIMTEEGDYLFYYLDDNGRLVTNGWRKIGGDWYFFNSYGERVDDDWVYSGGYWYYTDYDGIMLTGWQYIDGNWYYFKSNGAMAANEWFGGYWFNRNGSWTYPYLGSWHQNSVGWWFGDTSGWYARNSVQQINGVSYWFNSQGYWQP